MAQEDLGETWDQFLRWLLLQPVLSHHLPHCQLRSHLRQLVEVFD